MAMKPFTQARSQTQYTIALKIAKNIFHETLAIKQPECPRYPTIILDFYTL